MPAIRFTARIITIQQWFSNGTIEQNRTKMNNKIEQKYNNDFKQWNANFEMLLQYMLCFIYFVAFRASTFMPVYCIVSCEMKVMFAI